MFPVMIEASEFLAAAFSLRRPDLPIGMFAVAGLTQEYCQKRMNQRNGYGGSVFFSPDASRMPGTMWQ